MDTKFRTLADSPSQHEGSLTSIDNINTYAHQILVVDDEAEMQRLLQQRFRRKIKAGQLSFQFTRNGVEALKILKDPKHKIDVLLTDINMPEMDGLTLLENLADLETVLGTVVISAYGDMAKVRMAMNRGAFDFVTKPIDFKDLENTINKTLKFVSHLREKQQQDRALAQHCVFDKILDLQETVDHLKTEVLRREGLAKDLRTANQKLEQLSKTDPLTQIANRRHFNQKLLQAWQHGQEEQHPLSLILFDVDYFKLYNDYYGHLAGDQCLFQLAQAVYQMLCPANALAARYGGEEFVILLPAADQQQAIALTEQLYSAINQLGIPHQSSVINDSITISAGVATLIPSPWKFEASRLLPDMLIQQADQALYTAKQQGRNQYVVYGLS